MGFSVTQSIFIFDESLWADWYIEPQTAHSLHIYFQLIYSHYAALQTSTRGFLPHSDIPRYRRREQEPQSEMWGRRKNRGGGRKKRGGGGITKEVGRWGAHSFILVPVNSDTFDNVGSVSRALRLRHRLILSPLAQSPLEISHRLWRNEARPRLAAGGGGAGVIS